MLAYAASRPTPVERRPHPNTMLAIIALHVGVAAIVMSAKMDLPGRILHKPEILINIPTPKDPPPVQQPQPRTNPTPHTVSDPTIDHPPVQVPTPSYPTSVDQGPPVNTGVLVEGTGTASIPQTIHNIVRTGPALLTSGEGLKPPYPASKLITEEEASLQLRLTIDANGRVIGVEPVGRADPVFLSAARRWLLAHWRYKPATEDGRGVAATEVITLRFQLDG
jgi:protein TonB